MFNIVIDFGGTNIKIGLVQNGMVIEKRSFEAHSENGLIPSLQQVEEEIFLILKSCSISTLECAGIGIAMPGIVDPGLKRILSMKDKYQDSFSFNFENWTQTVFGLTCILENDAKAALLGEVKYGVAKGESDAVLVIFGTGIGTATIVNGSILRGKHHLAGNLGGHFIVEAKGRVCNCGNIGCVETHAGHWALPEIMKHHYHVGFESTVINGELNYHSIIQAAKKDDPYAKSLLDELMLYWCSDIVNLVYAFDPGVVILSGGLMKSADYLLPIIRERLKSYSWAPFEEILLLVPNDPDVSVLLGLSYLLQESANNIKEVRKGKGLKK